MRGTHQDMSTDISGRAALRREQARHADGKFGAQAYTRAARVDLDDGDWMVPLEADPTSTELELTDPAGADTSPLAEGVVLGEGAEYGWETTIGADTQVGAGSQIGDGCTVGRDVTIGANVRIGDGVTIGDGCSIGDGAVIHGMVELEDCSIGQRSTVAPLTDIRGGTIGDDCDIANDCRLLGSQDRLSIGDHTSIGEFTRVQDSTIGARSTIDAHSRLADCQLGADVTAGGALQEVEIGRRSSVRAGQIHSLRIGQRVTMDGHPDSEIRGADSIYSEVGDRTVMRNFRADHAVVEIGEDVTVDGGGDEVLLTGGVSIGDRTEVHGDVHLGDREDIAVEEAGFSSTDTASIAEGARIVGGKHGEKPSPFDVGESFRTVIQGGGTTVGKDADIARGSRIGRDVAVGERSRLEARTRIESGAYLGPDTTTRYDSWIGPDAELEAGVEVGEQTRIGAGAVCDEGARIADAAEVGSRATIGRMATITRGARIPDFGEVADYELVDQ